LDTRTRRRAAFRRGGACTPDKADRIQGDRWGVPIELTAAAVIASDAKQSVRHVRRLVSEVRVPAAWSHTM